MFHFLTATLNYISKVVIITFIIQYNSISTVSRKSGTIVSKHTCFLVPFISFFNHIYKNFYYFSTKAGFPALLHSIFSLFNSQNNSPPQRAPIYSFCRETSNL